MRLNSGLMPAMKALMPQLRWRASQSYELLGPLPLFITVLWLTMLFYLFAQLRPELQANTLYLHSVNQQLSVPLPISSPEAEQALSVTEYQQVKALFAILKKHGLDARESRYQLHSDGNGAQTDQLILEIPLTGDYLNLQAALGEMSASLPLKFESLGMARTSPDSVHLTMSLRITLSGEAR